MNEVKFWQIIDSSLKEANGNPSVHRQNIESELQQLTVEGILSFNAQMIAQLDRANTWDHNAVSQLCGCERSEQGFLNFRAWLIGLGSDRFETSLHDLESLASIVVEYELVAGIPDKWEFRNLHLTPKWSYFRKKDSWSRETEKEVPLIDLSKAPQGQQFEFTEDALRSRFPRLWDRFGDQWKLGNLLVAVQEGDATQVQQLVDEGADVNASDDAKNSPLFHAATWDYVEIVRILLCAGAEINARNLFQQSVLNRVRSIEAARLLVEHGADIHAAAEDGMTPLMDAANFDLPDVVSLYLELGVDVHASRYQGITALVDAVFSRTRSEEQPEVGDVVDLLLKAGADINVKSEEGETPLDVAEQCHVQTYVDFLISKGAKHGHEIE